jgi:succinate dehydrogenase/fumarate reductase flavoprotein subunit
VSDHAGAIAALEAAYEGDSFVTVCEILAVMSVTVETDEAVNSMLFHDLSNFDQFGV